MAFSLDNLKSIGNNQGSGKTPLLWIYNNAGGDTVTTAGYIPANVGVKARDQIIVVPADGKGALYNATVSSGVITLVANA
jgi:hypothetical protein